MALQQEEPVDQKKIMNNIPGEGISSIVEDTRNVRRRVMKMIKGCIKIRTYEKMEQQGLLDSALVRTATTAMFSE